MSLKGAERVFRGRFEGRRVNICRGGGGGGAAACRARRHAGEGAHGFFLCSAELAVQI